MIPTIFMGGQVAGLIGLVTALSLVRITLVVTEDWRLEALARELGLRVQRGIALADFGDTFAGAELLLSVHGRQIIGIDILAALPYGGINVHPCLWKFPGADPIGRWLASDETRLSVGAHVMTAEVDAGPVLREEFIDGADIKAEFWMADDVPLMAAYRQVYARLYPLYGRVVVNALRATLHYAPRRWTMRG